jgi:hypothetical protein
LLKGIDYPPALLIHFVYAGRYSIFAHSLPELIRTSEVNSVFDSLQIRSNTISAVWFIDNVS